MTDITLYGFPQSSYTWTTRIAAEEKGISHALESVEFGSPELLAIHPFGKIPVMKHGDFILYESSGICHYIDSAFDGPALQPADNQAHAAMEQWISNAIDYLYEWAIRKLVIPSIVVPMRGGERDEAAIADAIPHAQHVMSVTDKALGKSEFLAGDDYSIADMFLTPIAFYVGMTQEGDEVLDGCDALKAWLQKVQSRPSFAATAPPPPA